jgi:hypothetical protein
MEERRYGLNINHIEYENEDQMGKGVKNETFKEVIISIIGCVCCAWISIRCQKAEYRPRLFGQLWLG